MTSVNGRRAAPAGQDPLRFALDLDLAVRAWRRAIDERVGPGVLGELAPGAALRRSHLRLLSLTPPAGLRVTDLAARTGMTKQALGEFVAALQEAGLVEVAVDERDRGSGWSARPRPAGGSRGSSSRPSPRSSRAGGSGSGPDAGPPSGRPWPGSATTPATRPPRRPDRLRSCASWAGTGR